MKFYFLYLIFLLIGISCISNCQNPSSDVSATYIEQAQAILRDSVIQLADRYLGEPIVTVTAHTCARSAGGVHDFYSEGDYWWPDTTNPDSPFVRRDGMSYPDAFFSHRESLMRLSEIVGSLTSAYLLTEDTNYAARALAHCEAWFMTDSTHMNPHFLYAQAIKGRHTGRGIGIIDGIHFVDVFQSLHVLERRGLIPAKDLVAYKQWVDDFLNWHMNHPYGKAEMIHPNNHSMYFNLQVAMYAVFSENDRVLQFCRENFTERLLPVQMAANGSFPLELERTKPYEYSLFNLDGAAINCQILSDTSHNFWIFESADGKSMRKALDYMQPFVDDKTQWPLPPDVMYWEAWPIGHPAYLLGALAFEKEDYFQTWNQHAHFSQSFEVRRTRTIKNPLIWIMNESN
ncbi:MAG: alginate lyase family protein [Bacteroidota bacterium]